MEGGACGGLPHPPAPYPRGAGGVFAALGRYFSEVVGGVLGGDGHGSHAILRFRAVRPARFAHDGPRCHDAGRASQLGACWKVLLSGLLPKRILKSISRIRPVGRPVSADHHRPSCAQRAGLAGGRQDGVEAGHVTAHSNHAAPVETLAQCQRRLPLPLWGRGLGGGAAHGNPAARRPPSRSSTRSTRAGRSACGRSRWV